MNYNELKIKNRVTFNKYTFYLCMVLLFLIIVSLIFESCSIQKSNIGNINKPNIVQKPYIAVQVSEQLTWTYYEFINFSYTEGKQYFLPEKPQCKQGDTVLIKKYKTWLFGGVKTVFIKYKTNTDSI